MTTDSGDHETVRHPHPQSNDEFEEWLHERVRESVAIDAEALARLKGALRAEAPPRRFGWETVFGRRIDMAPLPAFALLMVLIAGAYLLGRRSVVRSAPPAVAPTAWTVSAEQAVRFVFTSSSAGRVTVVGDFNDWNPTATPLQPSDRDGVWWVDVPLPPGRHEYAFLVDGERWVADAHAPGIPEEDFGTTNSVVLVRAERP